METRGGDERERSWTGVFTRGSRDDDLEVEVLFFYGMACIQVSEAWLDVCGVWLVCVCVVAA